MKEYQVNCREVSCKKLFGFAENDYCFSTPCENSGTCESMQHGFKCQCPAGFYGKTCSGSSQFPLTFVETREISFASVFSTEITHLLQDVISSENVCLIHRHHDGHLWRRSDGAERGTALCVPWISRQVCSCNTRNFSFCTKKDKAWDLWGSKKRVKQGTLFNAQNALSQVIVCVWGGGCPSHRKLRRPRLDLGVFNNKPDTDQNKKEMSGCQKDTPPFVWVSSESI